MGHERELIDWEHPDAADLPDDAPTETVSVVQPGAAQKRYRCPGCEGLIMPRTFHLVVTPSEAPDLRRHWHRGCWGLELRRRGDQVG